MNDRTARFAKDGTSVKAWGTKGSGPGQFDNTHPLAMDSRRRLFIGDRADDREVDQEIRQAVAVRRSVRLLGPLPPEPSRQHDEQILRVNLHSRLGEHLGDETVGVRADGRLHLHGLERDERIAA